MTEDEAKQKWCPIRAISQGFVILTPNATITDKGLEAVSKNVYCVASDCMMWRWLPTYAQAGESAEDFSERQVGYCGLAGIP